MTINELGRTLQEQPTEFYIRSLRVKVKPGDQVDVPPHTVVSLFGQFGLDIDTAPCVSITGIVIQSDELNRFYEPYAVVECNAPGCIMSWR